MVSAQSSILIARPPEPVFAFVALDFYKNYRRWSPEVQILDTLSPGPIQVGSLARQERIDHGRRSVSTFRVTALEHPSRLEFADIQDRYHLGYRIEPAGDGTRLTLVFDLIRLEFYMRPFTRLIRKVAEDGAERAVQDIKGLVERELPPARRP